MRFLGVIPILLIFSFARPGFSEQKKDSVSGDCFFKMQSGKYINLNMLCDVEKNRKKLVKEVTSILDLKYVKRESDGSIWVELGADRSFQLPSGHIVAPNGVITNPDGTSYQPILKDGKYIGNQYFDSNGRKLNPGEVLSVKNENSVQQSDLSR